MVDRAPRKPRSSEKFPFPAVGVVTGLPAFAGLQLSWPPRTPMPAPAPASDRIIAAASSVLDLRTDAGNGTATVSWNAPTGAQEISYVVEALSEDKTLKMCRCAASELSCVIDGLTRRIPLLRTCSCLGLGSAGRRENRP